MANNSMIGTVYLARHADGFPAFQRFADSYRRYPAGVDHDLIIIYKGFEHADDLRTAKALFHDLPHIGIELDDIGFDIGSYLEVGRRVSHEYLCFLNTHTEIAAPDWLAYLFRYASQDGVGVTGATGSYESLRQSWELIQMFYWLYYMRRLPYEEDVARYYVKFTEYLPAGPNSPVLTKVTKTGVIGRIFNAIRARRYQQAVRSFDTHWDKLLSPGNVFATIATIPGFPNPHVRSNGFMLRRDRLALFQALQFVTKDDACLFESGPDSLTAVLRRNGLSAIVVGRDGKGYDVPDWWRSNTFRLGQQSNMLLTDNHSRAFITMSAENRATHMRMTWGDYLASPPADCPTLGVLFRKGSLSPAGSRQGPA
jgi:hypothetical protein